MNGVIQIMNNIPVQEEIIEYKMPNNMGTMYSKKIEPIVRATEKVGRNQLCTCGSGKKYKKCCIDYVS